MLHKPHPLLLIIDDSLDNQVLLKMLFKSKGFQVHCAANGREAIDQLTELSILPDLILLDCNMPVMDGHEFRVEQEKNERIKYIPVVVMTADSDLDEIDENMLHPRGILTKPLDVSSIIKTVSDCLV